MNFFDVLFCMFFCSFLIILRNKIPCIIVVIYLCLYVCIFSLIKSLFLSKYVLVYVFVCFVLHLNSFLFLHSKFVLYFLFVSIFGISFISHYFSICKHAKVFRNWTYVKINFFMKNSIFPCMNFDNFCFFLVDLQYIFLFSIVGGDGVL